MIGEGLGPRIKRSAAAALVAATMSLGFPLLEGTVAVSAQVPCGNPDDSTLLNTGEHFVPFSEIEHGYAGSYSPNRARNFLINNPDLYQRVWDQTHDGIYPPVVAPAVDFSAESVIAVIDQVRGSSGYNVLVPSIIQGVGYTIVTVYRTTPNTNAPTLQYFNTPFGFYRTTHVDSGSVTFDSSIISGPAITAGNPTGCRPQSLPNR